MPEPKIYREHPAFNPPDDWDELPPGRIPVKQNSRVVGLFGKRGTGKSLVLATFGLDAVRAGRPVYYYPEDYGFIYGTPMAPAELVQIPDKLNNATVLIDEIQELLSRYRQAATSSQLLMAFFRQVRKRGSDVIFTSNDPGNINHSVADQTDFHGFCKYWTDNRCNGREFHLKSCQDSVSIDFKDTQGKYGINPDRQDGRKKHLILIERVKRYFNVYRTESIADPVDVMKLTKQAIIASDAESKIGMRWDEFDQLLRDDVIPVLVGQGYQQIVPANFAAVLARERNIKIDPVWLGRRLSGLGLGQTRTRDERRYQLPAADQLDAWRDGVWSVTE